MTRTVQLEQLRNIGVIAHIDAGKTTISERILVTTGVLRAPGEVHDGTAALDWMPQERERGITITAAATTTFWKGYQINLIDTPGHVDFTVEVERSMRVLDGGVVVFDAVAGVEPQSETIWRQADKYGVARICFVNKMDRPGASFARTIAMVRARLGARAVAIQLPLGSAEHFDGLVDLLDGTVVPFAGQGHQDLAALSAELRAEAAQLREELVVALAEVDETIMGRYLEGQAIAPVELKHALRRATVRGLLVPVLCGAALREKGVHQLLDAIVDYLPSPGDLPAVSGLAPAPQVSAEPVRSLARQAREDEPFCGLIFKVVADRHVGKLAYVRVYSGALRGGAYVLNARRGGRERVARLLQMHANERTELAALYPGDIAAVVGLKQSVTGDTICAVEAPIVLEAISFPAPVIQVAVEARGRADLDRLGSALHRLAEEDPTMSVRTDAESGQMLVAGMGELHLEVLLDRIRREYNVEVRSGAPQVAYRETIAQAVEVEHRHDKQSGGAGQYAQVRLRLEPLGCGEGFAFVNATSGGVVPRQYLPGVERGVVEALRTGALGGYPVVDVRVTLLDGGFHVVDSSELAFQIAASMAVKEGLRQARPLLLEPVMRLDVETPDDYVGAVIGDLNARRGQIASMAGGAGAQRLQALVPLASLVGYSSALRSTTQGRAIFALEFARYQPVPPQLARQLAPGA